mmetsp:Transcript_43189/g.137351  ORF Transcript_43189/g.137351 Transcript_43189/m.137351 type:complete len:230 (-) Transcript_43189:101-790(-)
MALHRLPVSPTPPGFRSLELGSEQQKALARLAEYPKRVERLKRLWIDTNPGAATRSRPSLAPPRPVSRPASSGSGRARGSTRLACAGAAAIGHKPPARALRPPVHAAGTGGGSGHAQAHAGPLTAAQIRDLMTRELSPEDYELLLLLDEGMKRARTLSAGAATSLPQAPPGGAWLGEECLICLCALEEGEDVRALPPCGHVYHAPCIERWLSSSRASCPLCGVEIPEAA